jgi:hypothetical protein
MTSTIVKDSIVGDAWITQTSQAVPIQRVIDPKTGQPTGDILTGPVRLAFDTLFKLPQPSEKIQNPKYGASVLFTPLADFSIFYEEYYKVCAREFQDHYQNGQYYGLHSPFRDQAEKMKFGGFTPGCVFMTCTSKFKPGVVDTMGNPILDESKVYPGVWAICSVSPYAFKDPRKKGVAFGLQSVMLIGDDTKFGGGAPDPNQTFGGVKGAIQRPVINPGVLNHMPSAQQGAPGMPPSGPGGFAPPPPGGTYAPQPGQYAPPVTLQQPGMPPQQHGYQMPGQPAGDPRGAPPAGFASWQEYQELMG